MAIGKNYIALLRGINVGGKNKIPMKDLVSLCNDLAWENVKTHLQTGNVVFSAPKTSLILEAELEKPINSQFDLSIPVIVREAAVFDQYVAESPLVSEAEITPSQVLLYLTKSPVNKGALQYLNDRSKSGESVFILNQALWIHFPNGVGSSKLTPAVIDRAVGSTATGRNWNTVVKIRELLYT